MTDFKPKRVASLRRTIVHEDKSKSYENFGALISTPFPGVYSLILEVETDETGENGYPVRSPIVAFKAENGEKVVDRPRTDGARVFYNLTVWEDMDSKPPRD